MSLKNLCLSYRCTADYVPLPLAGEAEGEGKIRMQHHPHLSPLPKEGEEVLEAAPGSIKKNDQNILV